MAAKKKILIEVMYKADYCLPCLYMDEAVRQVLPQYAEHVIYRRGEFLKANGRDRFLELSASLFGEENVRRHCRVAPVPSLFIDGELVFDAIPPSFELQEAIEEAGLNSFDGGKMAMTYGSAFGCSGNVHRFYSQILADGPKYASPMEFNMSVTNAPPALVAQEVGFKGPIWVFVADEASWELSLHWAAQLIRAGKADQVVVSAAEEVSESILAIHHTLGLLEMKEEKGLILGEGAVSMVIESNKSVLERGARVYGTLTGWDTVQDSLCGPLDYSLCGKPLLSAASKCLQEIKNKKCNLLCVSPESGNKNLKTVTSDIFKGLNDIWHQNVAKTSFRSYFGESGISGGLGLAAVLLVILQLT